MIVEKLNGTITIPTSDTVTAGTVSLILNGVLGNLIVSVPALEATGTATILGTDNLGGTIYPSTAINESALSTMGPQGTPTYFVGTLYLSATASGTQSAAVGVTYNLYHRVKHG